MLNDLHSLVYVLLMLAVAAAMLTTPNDTLLLPFESYSLSRRNFRIMTAIVRGLTDRII